jgi:hypothetical protein
LTDIAGADPDPRGHARLPMASEPRQAAPFAAQQIAALNLQKSTAWPPVSEMILRFIRAYAGAKPGCDPYIR